MKCFVALFFLIIALSGVKVVLAASGTAGPGFLNSKVVEEINNNVDTLGTRAGYDSNMEVGDVVAAAINGFLGLLGIIFVILIVLAGFKWMNANGDEEKINQAKDTIKNAIIGLIIVVAAYSITFFVFESLPGSGEGTLG